MIEELLFESEERMEKSLESLREEFLSVRTSRANPSLFQKLLVPYYGSPTPLNQLAGISAPEPRLLVIQPFDKSALGEIEKAILASELGLTPQSDGKLIRINFPQLTEERRKDLCKVIRKKSEEAKVALRNIRRDANDSVKSGKKDSVISEDDAKKAETDIQKLTDRFVAEVDKMTEAKEKEIMTV